MLWLLAETSILTFNKDVRASTPWIRCGALANAHSTLVVGKTLFEAQLEQQLSRQVQA